MDKDMKRDQNKGQGQQSNLNRSESNKPTTGKGGTTHTEDTRRPSDSFEGSTGNISGETESVEESSDLERERESNRERNVEQ